MLDDPVHQHSRSDVYWTTVNATEAIPGTTTPLTWSYYSDATEHALRATFAHMGVLSGRELDLPADSDERFIGVFYAHPAANLTRFRLMADLAPGGSGDALERQFFGTVRTGTPPVNSRRRYPAVALRTPLALATVGPRVRSRRDEAHRWWAAAVRGEPDLRRDRRLVRAGAEIYRRVLSWHGVGTMLTQGLYDQLGRACTAAGLPGHELELVRGLDGVEESQVVADLWALARGRLDRARFIDRHGFHGPDEGELSAVVWRERPELLDATLATFAAMTDAEHPDLVRARSRREADAALSRLDRSVSRAGQARVRALIGLLRPLMALREVGRGGLVRALDGTRCAARRLGTLLSDLDALEQPEDVFFLTLDELCADQLPSGARERVAERTARHRRYLLSRLPDGWWGDPEPLAAESATASTAPAAIELAGAPGSPGVVTGIARVVLIPDQRDELLAGEILVCRSTDPGWAALMHAAAGLVIDIGGPLSHGAIVARELGVPCVIGTQHGSAAISSGDRVEVDGGRGRVRILERSLPTP